MKQRLTKPLVWGVVDAAVSMLRRPGTAARLSGHLAQVRNSSQTSALLCLVMSDQYGMAADDTRHMMRRSDPRLAAELRLALRVLAPEDARRPDPPKRRLTETLLWGVVGHAVAVLQHPDYPRWLASSMHAVRNSSGSNALLRLVMYRHYYMDNDETQRMLNAAPPAVRDKLRLTMRLLIGEAPRNVRRRGKDRPKQTEAPRPRIQMPFPRVPTPAPRKPTDLYLPSGEPGSYLEHELQMARLQLPPVKGPVPEGLRGPASGQDGARRPLVGSPAQYLSRPVDLRTVPAPVRVPRMPRVIKDWRDGLNTPRDWARMDIRQPDGMIRTVAEQSWRACWRAGAAHVAASITAVRSGAYTGRTVPACPYSPEELAPHWAALYDARVRATSPDTDTRCIAAVCAVCAIVYRMPATRGRALWRAYDADQRERVRRAVADERY